MASPNPNVSVQAGAAVGQGPDGKAVVIVILVSGLGQYQVPVAADQAEQFGDHLRDAIHKAAVEAKRANLGIVVATNDDAGLLLSSGRPTH